MSNEAGSPIWYELITPDPDGAKRFYDSVIGWTIEAAPSGDMDYRMITAQDGLTGGVLRLTEDMRAEGAAPAWLVYVSVTDVDATAAQATRLGGRIFVPPHDLPGVGRFALLSDPHGALFYVMRTTGTDTSRAFAPGHTGHCGWNELVTSDMPAALAFYGALFGWENRETMQLGAMGAYHFLDLGDDAPRRRGRDDVRARPLEPVFHGAGHRCRRLGCARRRRHDRHGPDRSSDRRTHSPRHGPATCKIRIGFAGKDLRRPCQHQPAKQLQFSSSKKTGLPRSCPTSRATHHKLPCPLRNPMIQLQSCWSTGPVALTAADAARRRRPLPGPVPPFMSDAPDFLSGGGAMGAMIRAFGWDASPLGPTPQWPQSLRTSVSTCLNCSFPILIWWGPDLIMIYNDAYSEILGAKHPAALGRPGRTVWPEIWDTIGPMLTASWRQGEAVPANDLRLMLNGTAIRRSATSASPTARSATKPARSPACSAR